MERLWSWFHSEARAGVTSLQGASPCLTEVDPGDTNMSGASFHVLQREVFELLQPGFRRPRSLTLATIPHQIQRQHKEGQIFERPRYGFRRSGLFTTHFDKLLRTCPGTAL